MAIKNDQFRILMCGKKELMEFVRKMFVKSPDVHLQFISSPTFLMSRAIFSAPNVVLLDAAFDRNILQDVLERFHSEYANVSMFPIATSANHHDVVDLMKFGATGYYVFPHDYKKLNDHLKTLLDEWGVSKSRERFARLQQRAFDFNQIIGSSPSLMETLSHAKKVIENTSLTVLITGETGTGKELLARAIHYNSNNCNSPFVDIACSALPENLLESELFGFEKGAFTDAREKKLGLFELAGDGSIFLDEIGDISLAMQSKLLKVIESRTMRRLGGLQDVQVKARIIAATSVDLESKMKSGQFRKDLYHRLKIIPLEIPPLRERKEDIPLLVFSFIDLFNKLYNKKIRNISSEALSKLMKHDWEGNIRELKHCIERAALLEEQDSLHGDNFEFLDKPPVENIHRRKDKQLRKLSRLSEENITLSMSMEEASLEEVQNKLAVKVLEYVGGNKSKAAYILRISRPRLDRILQSKHGT
jgi:DNA-binding NtrC family response regulator